MTAGDYARLQELFQRAILLDGPDRAALLDRECAGDSALRSELESLLNYHTQRTILARTEPDSRQSHQALQPVLRRITEGARTLSFPPLRMLRRHAATLAVLLLLLAASLWINYGSQTALRGLLHDKLHAVLATDVEALRVWSEEQRRDARFWAGNARVRQLVSELVTASGAAETPLREALLACTALPELRQLLRDLSRDDQNLTFAVIDRSGQVLAATRDDTLGARLNASGMAWQAKVFERGGQVVVTNPYQIGTLSDAAPLGWQSVIWIAAPVRRADGEAVASIGFGLPAAGEFSNILATANIGRTGETYAFDREGKLLSRSRFEPQLREIGLLPDDPQVTSALHVWLRDPGGDLTRGFRPIEPREIRPLTAMAASATAGIDGINIDGYRDYRGVTVVGAWRWLSDLDLGVATEMDYAEAYAPLAYPHWLTRGALGLLGVACAGWVWQRYQAGLLSSQVQQLQQFGQYQLEEELGRGGMGVVYRARHAWLRRPAAVKILQTISPSGDDERRFEREARLASLLSHPNTVAIYDFGQSDRGSLYCAMEFLPGLDLSRVLLQQGPCLSPTRAVHILKQICGSLEEAHRAGLVHRDLKPSNIMLCERGGLLDFVKVLDFGLATFVDPQKTARVTTTGQLTGTLPYLPPERIREPDRIEPQIDVYGLGAIGFELLTGRPPFLGQSPEQFLQAILFEPPPRSNDLAPFDVPAPLDDLIDACLSKEPSQRPPSVAEVADRLKSVPVPEWTAEDAARAWGRNVD